MTSRATAKAGFVAAIAACLSIPCDLDATLPPLDLVPAAASIATPRLAAHGYSTAVAWVETQNVGPQTLQYTVLKDAQLNGLRGLAIRTVAQPSEGIPSEPDITLDPLQSRPALVWVLSTPERDMIVHLAHRSTPEVIYEGRGILEFPVIQIDGQGTTYLAWSEIEGGQSRVMVAVGETSGWTIQVLSSEGRPYDVSPQIFPGNAGADLHWFSIDGAGVTWKSRVMGLDVTARWGGKATPLLPENRLPLLYQTESSDTLGAVWLDQSTRGEFYLNLAPGASYPNLIGDPGTTVEAPTVCPSGSGLVAWFETSDGRRQLVATKPGDRETRLDVSRTSRDAAVTASRNFLHLCWVQQDEATSMQSLKYWRGR